MRSKYTLLVKKSTLAAALGAAVIALAACQPVSPTGSMPTTPPAATTEATAAATATADTSAVSNAGAVQVNVAAAGIDMPAEVPSGIVTFAYQMDEGAPGIPEFARLNDGVTLDQFMQAAEQDIMAAVPLVTLIGNAEKKVGIEVTYDLKPGDYVGLVFQESGPPLTTSFAAGAATGAAEPQASVTAQLADFAFILPDEIAAGPQTWLIENTGAQWHEMAVVKLAEGTSVDDLLAMFSQPEQAGPPPFEDILTWSPIGAGQRAWVTWDLPAGEYTVICFLPDLAGDMSPHAAHGMVRTLVVK
jgi:hypothetical protein